MAEEHEDTPMQTDDTPAQNEATTPAQNDDTPMRTEEQSSDSGSGSDDEEEPEVEWMVTGREKRSTAGNRLTSLIQQEEPDDELELLFAEADDDAGFEDAEADSDVQMDSSDDDDDQGPAAGADDLDGEKELQRVAKAEKAKKKRKLNDGIPIFKKKVKIDPTASQAPAPRPKKKSERASWIPTAEELPTRASQRGTTKQQKKALHAQMVDREIKRLTQLENMEKAAAAKEAAKKPAMTQADRLAEATRVEKANSKSLSRWEEAEQQREEEQRAKLAALSNRHLEGPVITWWSGLAEWVGGKLKQVGKTLVIEEHKEKPATSKKRKLAEMEAESEATQSEVKPEGDTAASKSSPPTVPDQTIVVDSPPGTGVLPHHSKPLDQTSPPPPLPQSEGPPPDTKKDSPAPPPQPHQQQSSVTTVTPNAPTSIPPQSNSSTIPPNAPTSIPPQSNISIIPPSAPLFPQQTKPSPAISAPPPPPAAPSHPPFILAPPQPWQPHLPLPPPYRTSFDATIPLPGSASSPLPPQPARLMPPQTTPFQFSAPAPPPQPSEPLPPAHETTSRNLLILANFDEMQVKDKSVQTQILFGRKFLKASKPKPHSLCAITSQPAKYRDPQTGLAYYNIYAYKEIQRLKKGEYKWSALVGAYVGPGTFAARGVPTRFLTGRGEVPAQEGATAVR